MDAKTFRKLPVEIQAIQWTGDNTEEVLAFMDNQESAYEVVDVDNDDDKEIWIETLEGKMVASLNDWIIKGIKGEFYPCKPDIFEATYESVES